MGHKGVVMERDTNSMELAKAVAHLERNHEDMKRDVGEVRRDVGEVKEGVKEIRALLVGETEAPEKSLVWRVLQCEESIRKIHATIGARKKVVMWVVMGAATTLGAGVVTWAISGFQVPWVQQSGKP